MTHTGPTPTRHQTQHHASKRVLEALSGIEVFFPVWPAVLPSSDNPTIKPMAIRIDKDLVARMVIPEGMTQQECAFKLGQALGFMTKSYEYSRALSAPGAMRYDVDGNPVEPVSQVDADYARARLPGQPRPTTSASHLHHEVVHVKISALKVTLPLMPDQLKPIADATKTIDLHMDLGDGAPFTVEFSGKNYRKALRQIDDLRSAGNEVVVLMQGRLVAGHKIEGAGLSVQIKTPKPV